VELHAVETGNPTGRPILFLHGISQCWLTWSRQLQSGLARDFRLVALDLRGHGLSGKPREAYSDSRLWAEDVNSAIQTLGLYHPVLCGSSYGPLVILDYLRHFGEQDIGGVHFVGGVTKLGTEEATAVLDPGFVELVPGFFSTDVEESARSLESLLRRCFVRELAAADLFLMLGYTLFVPPYVRQALLSRSLDNDDLLPKIRKPVLITHGAQDAVVDPVVLERQMARIPHAQVHLMEGMGHAPFWDDAPAFNQRLADFARAL
jgi:pimeloyl-ACP methyl ester carboxylesterase